MRRQPVAVRCSRPNSRSCCCLPPCPAPSPPAPAGKWDKEEGSDLTTCDPQEKKYVTDKGPHQLVAEGKEVSVAWRSVGVQR